MVLGEYKCLFICQTACRKGAWPVLPESAMCQNVFWEWQEVNRQCFPEWGDPRWKRPTLTKFVMACISRPTRWHLNSTIGLTTLPYCMLKYPLKCAPALHWMIQQPMMVYWCINLLNVSTLANQYCCCIAIRPHGKNCFSCLVLAAKVAYSMEKIKIRMKRGHILRHPTSHLTPSTNQWERRLLHV